MAVSLRHGALVALGAAVLAGPAPAQAPITLQLVEVITSPQRTEVVQSLVDQFEEANPGVKVEITSLPWGQAFEKLATMVQGGQIPDVVEMPDRWMALYGCPAQLVEAVPVSESFEGRPVWHGVVHIFDLGGHRSADRCYAWSSRVEGSDQRRFFAVLHTPPIASPADAVRAAILQEPSPDRDGDQISTLSPAACVRRRETPA